MGLDHQGLNNNFSNWQTEEIIEWIREYLLFPCLQSSTNKTTYDKATNELNKRNISVQEILRGVEMVSDIYYALNNYYNNRIDSLETLKYIEENAIKGSLLKYNLDKFIYDKAIDESLCPKCLGLLTTKDIVTNIHEYMDGTAKETHLILKCELCGCEYE